MQIFVVQRNCEIQMDVMEGVCSKISKQWIQFESILRDALELLQRIDGFGEQVIMKWGFTKTQRRNAKFEIGMKRK